MRTALYDSLSTFDNIIIKITLGVNHEYDV